MSNSEDKSIFGKDKAQEKYVAFIDLLGFSAQILYDFHESIEAYNRLMKSDIAPSVHPDVQFVIYSDSFLLVSDEFIPLIKASRTLMMQTLFHNCVVRGGIAFGKHIESSNPPNLYILSEALVKAAAIEKTVQYPAVAIHPDIEIEDQFWAANVNNIDRILLYFGGQIIINPCNQFWGLSAGVRIRSMRHEFPQHRDKYDWLLELYDAIFSPIPMIPPRFFEKEK